MNELQKMQSLEKKLSRGTPLEEACIQCGVDLDRAKEFLDAKRELEDFNRIADGLWGRAAAVEAISELKKIIAESEDLETRRRACKDLLDFYRDERKRLEQKVEEKSALAGSRAPSDLFDLADSLWVFPQES